MNKFVKFPLVLGIVGLICGAALGVVNEVTSGKIQENLAKKANEGLTKVVSNFVSAEDITTTLPADELSANGITSVYKVYGTGNALTAYVYNAKFIGYASEVVYMVAIDPTEAKFIGFYKVSDAETRKGTLQDSGLGNQFTAGIDFATVSTDIVVQSGASTSMNKLFTSLDKVSSFHNVNVLGGEKTLLPAAQMAKLGLAEGTVLVDASEKMKATTLTNTDGCEVQMYVEGKNADEEVIYKGFIAKSKVDVLYEYEYSMGFRSVKFAYIFDENWENGKITVLESDNDAPYVSGGSVNDLQDDWIKVFNNLKMANLVSELGDTDHFDINGVGVVAEATYVSNSIKDTVKLIVSVYKEGFNEE